MFVPRHENLTGCRSCQAGRVRQNARCVGGSGLTKAGCLHRHERFFVCGVFVERYGSIIVPG